MTDSFHHRLEKDLAHRRQDQRLRELRSYPGIRLNLCSNDYFQLRRHPAVLAGARQALETFGAGSGASPLLAGFLPCHQDLLDRLKRWKSMPAGMLFNSGFMANQAVLKHLPGKNDLVLADRLIHHSLAQALTQGEARFKRYPHLDLDRLESLLAQHGAGYETVFVVTESVFSMDGDYPDLDRLAALKHHYSFVWILDEAHGTGVFGPSGGGLAEAMGVLQDVDVLVGTLGKALGSMGAYVLSPFPRIIDFLVNRAGEFIYSTFLSPAAAGAASAAVSRIQTLHSQRNDLRRCSRRIREQLMALGYVTNEFDTPIVPVLLGEEGKTLALRDRLWEQGILVGAVRPPTVPRGTSRLRISLHSGVTDAEADTLMTLLRQCKPR